MNSNEVWATCRDCGTELKQEDKQCSKCGSKRKSHIVHLSDKVGVSDSTKLVHKRKGIRRPLAEIITNRFKHSGDPKLKNGVRENMVIDREKDEYHHITKDAKTGKTTHEEHERLSEHNKREFE